MANGNWWDKYKTGGAAVAPEEEKVEPVAQEGNWWDKYKSTPAPEPVEVKPAEATPQANWWDKYKTAAPKPEQDPNKQLLSDWDKTTKEFDSLRKGYEQLGTRYQELGAMEARTPEQEQELQNTWNSLLNSGFSLQSSQKKVAELQPKIDEYFANQEKARFQATEELRLNPALSGVVDQLHDLDAQQKEQLRLIRESENTDEIKQKRAEEITSSIQKSKRDLIDGELSKSQGVENTLTSVAEALREKEAALEKRKTDIAVGAGATIATLGLAAPMAREAIGREEAIQAESQKKIDSILANVPAEERERYVKEAEAINQLVTGDTKAAIVNNELRVSPTILFDDEAIKEAINSSEATDLQKRALRQNIPQLQKNLAKQEIPIFNELSEFRDFVEERNLQNASDVEKIKAYKDFDGNWFGKLGAQAKINIQAGYANSIGQVQTLFGTAADLIARGTGSEKAREISDAFIGAAMDQGDEVEKLTRMSQVVGGPRIVGEIAKIGTEMVPIVATGGLAGLGVKAIAATGIRALTPAVVANAGFVTGAGTAGLQSYASVYSDATRTLRSRFMEEGMDEDEAMDLAMRQAYLPAVLAGITTAGLTLAGGKTGVEAVFRLGQSAAFKGTVTSFYKDLVKNVAIEGLLEEGPDELIQGMIAQATYNPNMSLGEIIEGAAKATALGGFFGGSVGAATYGIETAQARKAIATRRPITDFNMSRINALEGELKNLQTDMPLGSAEVGPFDMFNPSERASGVGARPMEKTKIDELTTRRAQLTKMLADEKLSSITQNDVESELAQADYEYVKLLAQGRNNLLTEQTLDKIGQLPAESTDAMRGLLKIANNMGAETLTGRERVALGITKVGNRFVAATEAPLIEAEANGTFSITDSGKQAVEAQNLIPLSRMIGISEGMKTQLEEEARIEEALRQEEAKREARRTAESDEAKRYGPQAAEALKQQVGSVPETPEAEQAKVRLAELLRRQQEVQRQAVEGLQKKEVAPEGEVPPTPPIAPVQPPAADIVQQAQARITEREGQAATPVETPTGTRIEAAAYQAPDGTVYYGPSHLDAMAKALEARKIDQAAIDAKQEATSRETPEFGFATNADPFVTRDQAETIARQSGQITVEQPATGKLHSNEVGLDAFPKQEAPPAAPTEPEIRPVIAPESLNPRGKQANKILTSVGVDPETAAFVAQQYQDEAGEMGAEEWREFVLAKFQENGGVIPAATRFSEDAEYYQLAFNVGPEEAAQMVENAKYQNQQMAQAELERNKQWRRKDEARVTEAERGVVAPPPTGEGVAVGAGEVPPRPAIEGRRVPVTAPAPEAVITPPPTAALPEDAMAGAITEEQANRIIEAAKRERGRKPPRDVPYRGRQATPLAPKDIIGKTAREALLETSRLNLSKIANRSPNEIMMQDVAAILAELNAPILDSEKVVSLSSIKRRGRARRVRLSDGRTVIAMPSSIRSTMETLVHEVGHTITADMVEKYAPRKKVGRGQNYLNALNKTIADPATPEPVQRLFSLYISTIEQLGITEQFFGAGGVAGAPDPDTSVALAQRRQDQGTLRVDLNSDQLYGLANVAEFVSQTFSEPAFRDLLKTLQDPTNPRKTLWQAFVKAIQKILQLPKGSMAAAVIEASVDIGMITPPSGVRARGAAPTPAPLQSVDNVFDEGAFRGKEGFKSRSKIVRMPIDDFLKIVTPLPREQSQEAQRAFDAGIKWESIPFLSVVTNTTGIAKVLGHEGRHRALVLKRAGYTEMPVEIRDRNIRWSEQTDPENFDYSKVFPTQLEAEKTDTRIPFPFTRDQAVDPYLIEAENMAPSPRRPKITDLDVQHGNAITSGDEETAQRLTDEVAESRGYQSNNLLFHGTTHIFNVFRKDRANVENDFGKGYYLTNTEADAQINYAGEGPDLTNRIERLSEQLQDNEDLDGVAARKKATEILSGGGQRIMRVYVRLNNPFNVGGQNETFLDYELPYDETTEEYGEPTGKLAEFLDALRPIIDSYAEDSAVDADKAIGNIVEYAMDRGGISASDLVRLLKQEDSGIMWASDENGDSATSEIIRQAIENAGFDGIVDSLVNEKFGKAKKIGKAMEGMGPDTVHTIVFNSNQIKSADSATYDDQGNLIPLSQRFLAEEEDIRFAPEEEFNIIPEQVEDQIEGTPEAATINIMGEAFRLADEQSASMGTPQGTLPLETITNAWINSGRDVNTLRNAIIRYTNLEPEAAATLADAIAQQVEIQRGIAEISDMASRRKAEKEAEPEERPYSFAQRIQEELPPALRSKINKAYEVLRNEVSVQEANQAMYGMDVKEAMEATMNMQNGVSMGVRSMMAQITLRKIIDGRKNAKSKKNKADYDALVEAHVDFVDWINEYLVEMGQGIQAFARFSDLGADGMLLKLRKDTEKAITKHIRNRKSKIDQIKKDVENADNSAFDASVKGNKNAMDSTAEKAAKQEAKQLTIEEQAQKLAIRAAKKVAGEEVRRRQPDPLSDLVNSHLRRYNANFIAEATAMGVSPVTAQAIEDSAKKLRDSRQAAKAERDIFKEMQDERMKVKKELARENKYIYGDRPTIWEDYQQMFSERLARRLMRDSKKKVPPSLLLFTDRLTENLLGFVPQAERQATTERSFQAMIEDALNNKEKYQEAFNKAMRDISAKVEELEAKASETEEGNEAYFQALAAQDFMDRLAPIIQDFPVSDKLVMRFVNQKMKAAGESLVAKYNEWYRSSKKTRLDIEQQLAQALVADVKISEIDALKLTRSIVKDFRAKAEERREKALARFKKPQEKKKKLIESPLKKFFELVNIGAMTDKDAYEIMAHRFDLPTWDPKFAKQVEEMAILIQDMPDGIERRRMTRNLMAEIAKKRGFNLADLGAGFAYSNILSSPDTFNVNLADTLINNFSNAFADAVSEKDFTRLRGVVAGYKKGWREAVQTFKTGLRINMPRLEEKTPLTVELVNYGKRGGVPMESTEGMNAIAKTILESPPAKVLNLWKYVTRIMEATDALNYTASVEGQRYAEAARIAREEGLQGKEKQKRINQILNLGNDVYQAALTQAEQEGYTGVDAKFRALEIQDNKIDPELKERSFDRGLRDVYRNMPKGLAGYFAARFDRIVSGIENPWVRNALKLGVSPFVITPTNLFNKWLDWSPYGYKRLFFGSGMFLSKEGPYYMEPSKVGSAEFYAQAFKASSSVFVMGLAMGLVKAGLLELVGRGPSDEEERKQWLADGNKPYTFSFMGGPQISFQYSPWALFLSVAANIANWEKYNKKEDATMLDRGVAAFIASTGVIMDLPFFAGPAEFLKAIESGSNKNYTSAVSKFVEGKMGMVFPNFLRYIDRLFDPTVYDHQGIKAVILDQTPFARRLGVQRINLFGEPIGEDKPSLDRLVGRFVAFPKPSRESRILAKYDIYPYMPSPKEAKALVDGEEAQMTEDQYNKFVQIVGKEAKQRVNDLFDPDAEITEQERERGRKRISQIFERARARAVREVSTY